MKTLRKFYDIETRNGWYYLCENGRPIARFNTLAEAEAVLAEWTPNYATDGQENYPPGWPENWQAFQGPF